MFFLKPLVFPVQAMCVAAIDSAFFGSETLQLNGKHGSYNLQRHVTAASCRVLPPADGNSRRMVEMKLLTVDFICDSSPTRSFSLPGVWWWCGAQGYCFAVTRQRNFCLESVGQSHLNIDQWSSMYGTFFRLRFSFRGDQRWPRKRTNLRKPKRKQWLNMDPEYCWFNHILAWKTDIIWGKRTSDYVF